MKQKLFRMGVFAVTAASVLAGCSDEWGFSGKGTGSIAPMVGIDTKVVSSVEDAPGSRAEGELTAGDLSLRLVKTDGSKSYELGTLASFDASQQFPTGAYTVEAYYGDPEAEGFDTPAYKGSQDITIVDGGTTEVGLTATMANAMVSLTYSEAFQGYMTDWSATVNSVAYAKDETRPVYVAPGDVRISVSFTKPNGKSATIALDPVKAEARYHYHVNVDVNGGEASSAVINVTFDENFATENVDIDISDEILSAPVPTIEADGFTAGEAVTAVSGMTFDGKLTMNIIALAGIKDVTMTTASEYLTGRGWPATVSLLNPGSALSTLQSFGLSTLGLWNKPGEMAVIDFTGVIPFLKAVEGDNSNVFTVTVTDKYSRVSEPLELRVNVEGVQLTLFQEDTYENPGQDLQIGLDYNGSDVMNNVRIEYVNNYAGGLWAELPIKAVTEDTKSRASKRYLVTVTIPATHTGDLKLRAKCADVISAELKVAGVPFAVEVDDNDIFATRGTLHIVPSKDNTGEEIRYADAEVEVSADGADYKTVAATRNGEYFSFSGLTPGRTNLVRVKIGNMHSAPAEVAAEQDLQIPNGNLDADVTVAASAGDWKNIVFQGWGTNNAMTTSQPTGSGWGAASNNKLCKAISGTEQTTDAHAGKAALIRTVGWGGTNTATGDKGTSGDCKYTDPGLLHLGATRTTRPSGYGENDNKTNSTSTGPISTDDLDCGIDFASRPSSLTFWYKYSPKNSADKGSIEVWFKDAAGNVITSAGMLLDATGDYTQKTITFDFANKAKCAKMYVKFLSSYDMEYVKRTNDNFSGPGFAGSKPFMGSQLYIDDIELTY